MNDCITTITFNGWWKCTLFFSNMSNHNRELFVFLQIFKTQIWLLLYPFANASTDLGWNRTDCRFCFSFTAGTTTETTSPCLLTTSGLLFTFSTTDHEIIPTFDFFPQCTWSYGYEFCDLVEIQKALQAKYLNLDYCNIEGLWDTTLICASLLSCPDSH